MTDFKIIETQEELNSIIKERLERERNSVKKEYDEKYKDYDELKNQISAFNDEKENFSKQIKELQEKASLVDSLSQQKKQLETDSLKVKVAYKNGIPFEMASRLNGDDEESLSKDAQNMAKFMQTKEPMLRDPESKAKELGERAYQNLVKGLKLED